MSEYDDLVERLAKALCNNMAISDDAKRMCWEQEPTRAELFRCARATLDEIHSAGLRIVPEKPTEAHCDAMFKTWNIRMSDDGWRGVGGFLGDLYTAVIAASPYAPKDK
jgi:hypothetical protein